MSFLKYKVKLGGGFSTESNFCYTKRQVFTGYTVTVIL